MITDYKKIAGGMFDLGKAQYVKYTVQANFLDTRSSRSINGAIVGNRHARKNNIRLYNLQKEILLMGSKPIQNSEYCPDI